MLASLICNSNKDASDYLHEKQGKDPLLEQYLGNYDAYLNNADKFAVSIIEKSLSHKCDDYIRTSSQRDVETIKNNIIEYFLFIKANGLDKHLSHDQSNSKMVKFVFLQTIIALDDLDDEKKEILKAIEDSLTIKKIVAYIHSLLKTSMLDGVKRLFQIYDPSDNKLNSLYKFYSNKLNEKGD